MTSVVNRLQQLSGNNTAFIRHIICTNAYMKNFALRRILFCYFLLFTVSFIHAQQTSLPANKQKIAVLAPLYLDSAFDGNNYKLTGINLPKYILPGLDFYHGVNTAIDSLQKENTPVDVIIYDTKQAGGLNSLLANIKQQNVAMILASFNNSAEQKTVSDFSFSENIPVISATYPNDANLGMNPFFVMVNSSLKTHVDAMYNYVQRNYAKNKILFITKSGVFESRIKNQFDNLSKQYKSLSYKTLVLPDNYDPSYLLSSLDSTKQNLVICGSLNDNFGLSVVRTISAAASYKTTVIGMPTWESDEAFNNTDCNGVEVVYSTPYNYSRTDKTGASLTNLYKLQHNGRPSDMYFKGFETMYHFSKLLVKYHTNMLNNISESSSYKIANDFNFQPVRLSKESYAPDFLENKKLYFVKKIDGQVKGIN